MSDGIHMTLLYICISETQCKVMTPVVTGSSSFLTCVVMYATRPAKADMKANQMATKDSLQSTRMSSTKCKAASKSASSHSDLPPQQGTPRWASCAQCTVTLLRSYDWLLFLPNCAGDFWSALYRDGSEARKIVL